MGDFVNYNSSRIHSRVWCRVCQMNDVWKSIRNDVWKSIWDEMVCFQCRSQETIGRWLLPYCQLQWWIAPMECLQSSLPNSRPRPLCPPWLCEVLRLATHRQHQLCQHHHVVCVRGGRGERGRGKGDERGGEEKGVWGGVRRGIRGDISKKYIRGCVVTITLEGVWCDVMWCVITWNQSQLASTNYSIPSLPH